MLLKFDLIQYLNNIKKKYDILIFQIWKLMCFIASPEAWALLHLKNLLQLHIKLQPEGSPC